MALDRYERPPDQHRLMYVMIAGPTMVVLHGCKKESRKASKPDLAVARPRIKQVLDEEARLKHGKKTQGR